MQLYSLLFAGTVRARPIRQRMVAQIQAATVQSDGGRKVHTGVVDSRNLTLAGTLDYAQYKGGDWMMAFRFSKFVLTPRYMNKHKLRKFVIANGPDNYVAAWEDPLSRCLLHCRSMAEVVLSPQWS